MEEDTAFAFESLGLSDHLEEEDDNTYVLCVHSAAYPEHLALSGTPYPAADAALGFVGHVIEQASLGRFIESPDRWLQRHWFGTSLAWADWHYRAIRADLFGAGFTNTEPDEFAGGMSLVRVPLSSTIHVLIDDQYNHPKWTVGLVDVDTGENIESCTVETTAEVIAIVLEYQAEWGEYPTLVEAVQAVVNRSTLNVTDKARALTQVLADVLDGTGEGA